MGCSTSQLLDFGLGRQQRTAQVLGPYPCVAGLEEAPGFWLCIGSVLAIVAIWNVTQRMEDLALSLLLSL